MRTVLAAGILLAASSFSSYAGETHSYTVLKDGEPIGEKSVTFNRDENVLKVAVNWDVEIEFAGLTFFRYEHSRVEQWVNGSITTLTGHTHDDGTDYDVSYQCGGEDCVWTVNGNVSVMPNNVAPASVWNKIGSGSKSMISPVDKELYEITIKPVGWQTVETGQGPVKAELVKVRGNIERDLWYDATDRLVRMRFAFKDAEIELVLSGVTNIQTAQD